MMGKVVMLDTDIRLRNLDVVMGLRTASYLILSMYQWRLN